MSETLIQELRKCSTCSSTKLLETYFSKNVKGQYYKTCDKCRVRMKENKAKRAEYNKKYNIENKERLVEQKKKYYDNNKEKILEDVKIYYDNNKDKVADYKKIYRAENKEKIAKHKKKYREENKEEIAEKEKKYREENKDKVADRQKKYRVDKRHHCDHNVSKQQCKICCPNGHLKHAVSRRVWDALKKNKYKKSLEYLGCDIPTFKEHIEKTFKEGMTWDNHGYGSNCWNIDHIIPVLYKQDNIEPSIEEVGKRLHYSNTQAMWATENISKGCRFIG